MIHSCEKFKLSHMLARTVIPHHGELWKRQGLEQLIRSCIRPSIKNTVSTAHYGRLSSVCVPTTQRCCRIWAFLERPGACAIADGGAFFRKDLFRG